MLWLVALAVVLGLAAGALFRFPFVLAASAVLAVVGALGALFAGWSWAACLIGPAALQSAYAAALLCTSSCPGPWRGGGELNGRDRRGA